jgi:hypothetical protein
LVDELDLSEPVREAMYMLPTNAMDHALRIVNRGEREAEPQEPFKRDEMLEARRLHALAWVRFLEDWIELEGRRTVRETLARELTALRFGFSGFSRCLMDSGVVSEADLTDVVARYGLGEMFHTLDRSKLFEPSENPRAPLSRHPSPPS